MPTWLVREMPVLARGAPTKIEIENRAPPAGAGLRAAPPLPGTRGVGGGARRDFSACVKPVFASISLNCRVASTHECGALAPSCRGTGEMLAADSKR